MFRLILCSFIDLRLNFFFLILKLSDIRWRTTLIKNHSAKKGLVAKDFIIKTSP
jgi:hypothetical protein